MSGGVRQEAAAHVDHELRLVLPEEIRVRVGNTRSVPNGVERVEDARTRVENLLDVLTARAEILKSRMALTELLEDRDHGVIRAVGDSGLVAAQASTPVAQNHSVPVMTKRAGT